MDIRIKHDPLSIITGNVLRSVAREIIKEDGLGRNGLLGKGITATMGRNGFFNMIYFGFYHTMKTHLPSYDDSRLEFCRKVSVETLT